MTFSIPIETLESVSNYFIFVGLFVWAIWLFTGPHMCISMKLAKTPKWRIWTYWIVFSVISTVIVTGIVANIRAADVRLAYFLENSHPAWKSLYEQSLAVDADTRQSFVVDALSSNVFSKCDSKNLKLFASRLGIDKSVFDGCVETPKFQFVSQGEDRAD